MKPSCVSVFAFLAVSVCVFSLTACASENYEQVNPSELSCYFKDLTYTSFVSPKGEWEIEYFSVGEFSCEGQKIELVSNKSEGEFLTTKAYGKVKVTFVPSRSAPSVSLPSLWLTPQQKSALKALKAKTP